MLFLTVSISFLAQLALIYLPLMQGVFQTEALSLADLGTVLSLGLISMSLHEGRRFYERGLSVREEREGALMRSEEGLA
jgi:Ca2+-transporting ATPase